MNSTPTLTQEWDKAFPQNNAVDHCKVTFHNRFGIELAADLYKPKGAQGPFAAVAVSGPFGAVKEQCSGLYAQELAARGFLTVAFDPSYTGESGGTPRYVASPDINTEDFSAAVDFLSVHDDVDPERIGILGICGWGGMALNAAAIDTRIKATVTSTMYDMTRVTANGYFDTDDNPDARYALRQALNAQRTADYKAGTYQRAGGVVDPVLGRRGLRQDGGADGGRIRFAGGLRLRKIPVLKARRGHRYRLSAERESAVLDGGRGEYTDDRNTDDAGQPRALRQRGLCRKAHAPGGG